MKRLFLIIMLIASMATAMAETMVLDFSSNGGELPDGWVKGSGVTYKDAQKSVLIGGNSKQDISSEVFYKINSITLSVKRYSSSTYSSIGIFLRSSDGYESSSVLSLVTVNSSSSTTFKNYTFNVSEFDADFGTSYSFKLRASANAYLKSITIDYEPWPDDFDKTVAAFYIADYLQGDDPQPASITQKGVTLSVSNGVYNPNSYADSNIAITGEGTLKIDAGGAVITKAVMRTLYNSSAFSVNGELCTPVEGENLLSTVLSYVATWEGAASSLDISVPDGTVSFFAIILYTMPCNAVADNLSGLQSLPDGALCNIGLPLYGIASNGSLLYARTGDGVCSSVSSLPGDIAVGDDNPEDFIQSDWIALDFSQIGDAPSAYVGKCIPAGTTGTLATTEYGTALTLSGIPEPTGDIETTINSYQVRNFTGDASGAFVVSPQPGEYASVTGTLAKAEDGTLALTDNAGGLLPISDPVGALSSTANGASVELTGIVVVSDAAEIVTYSLSDGQQYQFVALQAQTLGEVGTGIDNTLAAKPLLVAGTRGGVTFASDAQGVIISDLSGRIVYHATSIGRGTTLALSPGCYIISSRTATKKVIVR